MASQNEHIVMLPFMAHGHLIPFLELARKIHRRTGFTITIANTPLNISYLRSTMAGDDQNSDKINLAELYFCSSDHGLPPDTENTENLTLEQIGVFFSSSVNLKTPSEKLLFEITKKDGKPPICVISDNFYGWAVDVAKSAGTINVSFTTGGAYGTLAYMSVWLNLPHLKSETEEFNSPGFPDRCRFHITMLHRFIRNTNGNDIWSRFMQPQLSKSMESSIWLCSTVEEIEPLALDWLRSFLNRPVWAIGPLLPREMITDDHYQRSFKRSSKKLGVSSEECIKWLDSHSPESVLYISFGSQNTISPSQMMALAHGLETIMTPFIWVIRPPVGYDLKGEFRDEWLPKGFKERIRMNNRGLVVHNWAPQLEILSHKSTGAFMSHCGWNSVMESLSQGVPIIGWPMAAEQSYNSKMLVEEMGVGVELVRGVQSVLEAEKVKSVIELVMDKNGKGEEMKKKATKIKFHIRASIKDDEDEKGSSIKAVDGFIASVLLERERMQVCPNGDKI